MILQNKFTRLEMDEASEEQSTLAKLSRGKWDLLILDINLPGRSGLEILHTVKERRPNLPVLVYSVHSEDQFAPHLLRAGARGYLNKEHAAKELCTAVIKVLQGETYVSAALAQQIGKAATPTKRKGGHEKLSRREFQVLRLFTSGKLGNAAAHELGLNAKTISTYRSRMFKKLNVKNTAELIRYALREGLA